MDIPPREHLLRRIRTALVPPYAPPLYLHGPPSTAKESTLRRAAPSATLVVTIDCVLHHTDRLLFCALASALCDNETAAPSVSDAPQLLDALRRPSVEKGCAARHIVYLARADRLMSSSASSFSPATVSLLFQLPRLCERRDLRVVLGALVPFSVFRHSHAHPLAHTPVTVYFAPLTAAEIVRVLATAYAARQPNPTASDTATENREKEVQVYSNFTKAAVDILYSSSNDPFLLRRVVDALFPEYHAAYTGGHSHRDAPVRAFNQIRDRLTVMLNTTDFASSQSDDTTQQQQQQKHGQENAELSSLPNAAKVLLVAVFLGSVISPTFDVRHFSAEKMHKRSASLQKAALNNAVPLERLLAIYHAIYPFYADDAQTDAMHVGPDHGVSGAMPTCSLAQLSTLAALGWITRDSSNTPTDRLSEPRYRCRLPRDEVIRIATSINIEIHDYLLTQ